MTYADKYKLLFIFINLAEITILTNALHNTQAWLTAIHWLSPLQPSASFQGSVYKPIYTYHTMETLWVNTIYTN